MPPQVFEFFLQYVNIAHVSNIQIYSKDRVINADSAELIATFVNEFPATKIGQGTVFDAALVPILTFLKLLYLNANKLYQAEQDVSVCYI